MRWPFVPLAALSLWACGTQGTLAAPVDAGAPDVESDAGVPCDTTGISKGPWVLHVDGTSAVVRWEACRAGTQAGMTYVPESGGATSKATATESQFFVINTIKAPLSSVAPPDYAGIWYMHEADLTGLAPSTCYTYGLDADATIKGRFCTARSPGQEVKFAIIGDTNPSLGPSTTDVLNQIVPIGFDFTMHGGDIEYYDSYIETYAYWFELMPSLLREAAFLPAIGNHDSDDQTGEPSDKYQQYTQRFWGNAGFDGVDATYQYYSFQSGGVWFLTLDTEEPTESGSPQFVWLESELAKAKASPGFRFSVLYLHRPMLTCGDTGDNTTAFTDMQPLFTQYGVPLVVQAHMHSYERFEMPGLTVLTVGGGGAAIGNPNANTTRSYCNERVASGAFYHAAMVDITPGQYAVRVIDEMGSTRDEFQHTVP